METKSEMQKYIDEHIKSIVVEKRGDEFYGILTDKEGRTFECRKDVSDIYQQFCATHINRPNDDDILQAMLMKQFEMFFVGVYKSRRAFGNLEVGFSI